MSLSVTLWPASYVDSSNFSVAHRISMSGWWLSSSATTAILSTTPIAAGNVGSDAVRDKAFESPLQSGRSASAAFSAASSSGLPMDRQYRRGTLPVTARTELEPRPHIVDQIGAEADQQTSDDDDADEQHQSERDEKAHPPPLPGEPTRPSGHLTHGEA